MKNIKFSKLKKTFIVAEIGNNHEGSLSNAFKLIKKAKECGADAVKFQTFIPELYSNPLDFNRQKILKKFRLSFEEFEKIAKYANTQNIIFGSTPFDLESAKFLKKICSFIKISSGDNNYLQMIDLISKLNKPVIISTGLLSSREVLNLFNMTKNKFKDVKNNLSFLHCISSYPAKYEEINLRSILKLKKKIPIEIGFSDHTIGNLSAITAAALGIKIIEKHFTLDNNFSSFRDHSISANPKQFKNLVNDVRNIEIILGKKNKLITADETKNKFLIRRSLYAKNNLFKNKKLKSKDILICRPGTGLSPESAKKLINKKIKKNIKKNSLLRLGDFF